MTQAPPPAGYQPQGTFAPQPARSNPLAIISLICGIVGCLVITPIIGIITGVLALPKARVNGGKGLAIAGIILSVLWIVGGIGGGYAAYRGGQAFIAFVEAEVAKTAKQPTITFVNHLVDGDVNSASAMSGIDKDDLTRISDYVKPLGKCSDINITAPRWQNNNGVVTASFDGTAVFEKGTKSITAEVVLDENGPKVQQIELK